ncbi:metal dependent phosphohydrolase [Desulforamulus reducens MI-1]|uniref:Metal dependent phosphohydrolase n=1 Tax=Desulforamulus reducens (strain ATCC BAA-1160 / DSM 100696 / MI-1) TaxID=349161 RepID=A4J7V4_DESRM|nr:HD-GYP domain-containing protein [Desulforamulus reducens]ABO51157.1 metal dependent phosphohydrolase [Desulforamulus reducens MI-1]
MRKIPLDYIRPGMQTAKRVYSASGHVLLNAGVKLTSGYIQQLKKLGIPSLYIEDKFTEDILIKDVIPDELRMQTIKEVKNIFSKEVGSGKFTYQDAARMERAVQDIITELICNRAAVVNITDIRSYDDYTYAHSVNVCILAILAGLSMELSKPSLYHLGMGALLHDIGKVQIPRAILNKPGKLTAEEFTVIKNHSTYSYNSLRKYEGISHLSALIAYEHHEKYDGSGYPKGLKQGEIHQLSQITGMVDMYDALTADRVYRKAFPPQEACEMIAAAGNYFFDFNIIDPFLRNIAPYPLGTFVELSNGCLGVVVEVEKGYPANPTVRVLLDQNKEPTSSYLINLGEKLDLVISQVVPENQLLKLEQGKLKAR